MSTFSGKIVEIEDISVDRFDEKNESSEIYFLSHCHIDHMVGLSDFSFQKSLLERFGVYLYASPVSVAILKRMYPHIAPKLKPLPLYNATLIKVPRQTDTFISVTLIPAGHCPGSVMFLFETDKTILYTGDYRVNVSDLTKFSQFYTLEEVKRIDKMYLDTTFFKKSYATFPLRDKSLEETCSLIRNWIEQSKQHEIHLRTSARYGSEYLFMEIAKQLKMRVHVNEAAYDFYKHIPEMDHAITLNGKDTQIHSACGFSWKYICKDESELIRSIKPSALCWIGSNYDEGIVKKNGWGEYKVCYSCHASYEEICEFVTFLKPMEIDACVVPTDVKARYEMYELLEELMSTYQKKTVREEKCDIKFLKSRDVANTVMKTPEKSYSLPSNLLSSPTRSFKRKRL